MGPPMLPTPMNPTFTISSPRECDGRTIRQNWSECFASQRGGAIWPQDREDARANGAQQAASDSASAAHAGAGQHAHGRRRRADPGPDAHRPRAGADLLARHDGHAAGRRVGRRPGGRAVRREALRQGGARLAAPGAHAGRRRAVHRRDAGAQLAEGAQHPAADLRASHDADLPRGHARHRRAARHQVGAAERRRGDRRGARHDRAHARHDRPVRLQLPLQLVLPQRQPSLCRIAGARARSGDEDARPAARGHHPAQEPPEARAGCRLHERHRRPHHPRAPRGSRRRRGQARPAGLHAERGRQAERRAARRRQHPLPDEHLPDRRPRDHERDAVVCRSISCSTIRT